MEVLSQLRWCVILIVLTMAVGWAVQAMPTAGVEGGSVSLAEGGGDGGDGEGDEGIDFA